MLLSVARSHICIACGHDLTRLHAPPDPHYALPIVVCPTCARASVRRPYAGAARGRAAVRLGRTWFGLVLRVAALVVFPAMLTSSSLGIAQGLNEVLYRDPIFEILSLEPRARALLQNWLADVGVWLLPVWVLGTIGTGIAFGGLFHHWRLRWFPVGVAAVVITAAALPLLVGAPVLWAYGQRPFLEYLREAEPDWHNLRYFWWPWVTALALAWAIMPTGQRHGRKALVGNGLRSRRLKQARKQRSRA